MISNQIKKLFIILQFQIQSINTLTSNPAFSISSWNQQHQSQSQNLLNIQTQHPSPILPFTQFPSYNFSQLITHSNSHSNSNLNQTTFFQRYWFDTQYYKEGGPVILLDGGETNAQERLPFLENGILNILIKSTNGIGIILEHRFYGQSFPFDNLSIESLKYLNTFESLEDSAYFSKHIVLPGYEHLNITSTGTPWIYYGGSYAGAKAAFMIKLYPDLIWGSIASSAVIHAQVDFWEYYEPIRIHASKECIKPLIIITRSIDKILFSNDSMAINSLKDLFGLKNLTDNRDFVNVLASPIGSWQERNWDPKINNPEFENYCNSLKPNPSIKSKKILPNSLKTYFENEDNFPLDSFLKYTEYIKSTISCKCNSINQDECFGTGNLKSHQLDSLNQTWRSWMWQVCTEWGYFQTSSPDHQYSLISKLITLEYTSRPCKLAFGSSIPKTPNVTKINQYGEYNIRSKRLGYIDGTYDPWIYVTVHSPLNYNISIENQVLIEGGIHHWDENGNQNEPDVIQNVHQIEVGWVKEWIMEFNNQRSYSSN